LIKQNPRLRQYLTRCQHCGILFFTDPRNAGRKDIRCPFGCRQTLKKKNSNRRSREYYQTDEGRGKKKNLNDTRGKSGKNKPEETEQQLDTENEERIDQDLLVHLQLVAWHIEGRRIALDVIHTMVYTLLRQHSMYFHKKRAYHCSNFVKPPP
jgi:hypothetical protein